VICHICRALDTFHFSYIEAIGYMIATWFGGWPIGPP
jgi:hypothetical protein